MVGLTGDLEFLTGILRIAHQKVRVSQCEEPLVRSWRPNTMYGIEQEKLLAWIWFKVFLLQLRFFFFLVSWHYEWFQWLSKTSLLHQSLKAVSLTSWGSREKIRRQTKTPFFFILVHKPTSNIYIHLWDATAGSRLNGTHANEDWEHLGCFVPGV